MVRATPRNQFDAGSDSTVVDKGKAFVDDDELQFFVLSLVHMCAPSLHLPEIILTTRANVS